MILVRCPASGLVSAMARQPFDGNRHEIPVNFPAAADPRRHSVCNLVSCALFVCIPHAQWSNRSAPIMAPSPLNSGKITSHKFTIFAHSLPHTSNFAKMLFQLECVEKITALMFSRTRINVPCTFILSILIKRRVKWKGAISNAKSGVLSFFEPKSFCF